MLIRGTMKKLNFPKIIYVIFINVSLVSIITVIWQYYADREIVDLILYLFLISIVLIFANIELIINEFKKSKIDKDELNKEPFSSVAELFQNTFPLPSEDNGIEYFVKNFTKIIKTVPQKNLEVKEGFKIFKLRDFKISSSITHEKGRDTHLAHANLRCQTIGPHGLRIRCWKICLKANHQSIDDCAN